MPNEEEQPALLVLDASYTLEMIKQRGIEKSVLCRDLDGFFRHVWSVHPFATLLTSPSWAPRYGSARSHRLAPRHTFVEGTVGLTRLLGWAPPLNFLAGQAVLLLRLARLVRRERVAVIRVGDPLYLGLFGLALARLTGRPLAIRVNGNNRKIRENTGAPVFPRLFRSVRLEERVERFVLRRADLVAAINRDNADFALAAGARPERLTLFPLGNLLAEEHWRPPSERPLDSGLFERLGVEPGRYLLCVGRLEPVKFPEDALRVLAGVVRSGHDVKLVFAGDGSMRQQLESMARSEGVHERVVFAGNQNQQALAQLNAQAAAVVSPLTGRALSESALGAAPIAAYDLDWQGDLIRTGETGELVPFRQVGQLTEAVERLLADRGHARAMGEAVRRKALAMLDPQALDEHERQEYSRLLMRFGSRLKSGRSG